MERRTPFPIIQGHENVGRVEAVGDADGPVHAYDGTVLQVGDRVVPAPNVTAGTAGTASAASPTTCAATSRTTATR